MCTKPLPRYIHTMATLLKLGSSQFHSGLLLLPIILLLLAAETRRAYGASSLPTTRPGCPDKCGDVLIPFPFGTGSGCFLPGFEVTCNNTFDPPRPFITNRELDDPKATWPYSGVFQDMLELDYPTGSSDKHSEKMWSVPLELFSISVADNEARAYGAISSDCSSSTSDHHYKYQGTVFDRNSEQPNGEFLLSPTKNVLVGVGSSVEPVMASRVGDTSGFWASCVANTLGYKLVLTDGSCTGRGCCEAPVPPEAETYSRSVFSVALNPRENRDFPCNYGMMVEKGWYKFVTTDIKGDETLPKRFPRGMPFVFDFAMRKGTCPAAGQLPPPDHACVSDNSYCASATNGNGYVCKCSDNYEGNPYIKDGCQDINECENSAKYPCEQGTCKNKQGGYDCLCRAGMKGDGKKGNCTEKFPTAAKAVVGGIGGIFILALVSFLILLRKEKRKTIQFYAKNGGPTLEKAKIIKIFKTGALKHILKSSNIIGKGGFGEVYKGVVGDEIVAVKKPINASIIENEQFANEVIIQSQVIHRNIVRLIGCCLEVDLPMLVYEFLSRGSLDDILHGNNMKPLNLVARLRIAAESADGLAYMHSKANTRILHGDVKPANILLDDDLVPKISDFGISRLIPRDKEHTLQVIGDMSYMDPVYLQTGLLTEKSDVYSFGVVLLELISRKKATHSDNYKLVNSFLEEHKKGKASTELFDKEIAVESDLEILDNLAELAVECLNLDVDQRPAMTEVAHRLLLLYRSRVI